MAHQNKIDKMEAVRRKSIDITKNKEAMLKFLQKGIQEADIEEKMKPKEENFNEKKDNFVNEVGKMRRINVQNKKL